MHHLRLLSLSFVTSMLVACGGATSPTIESADELNRYAESPGIKLAHLPALREELARLESEGGTPTQLMGDRWTTPTAFGAAAIPPSTGPAMGELQAILAPELRASLGEQLDEVYPVGPFVFSPTALQAAVQLKDRYNAQRRQIQDVVSNLERGFEVQFPLGLGADTSFTEIATIGNRLHALAAAEFLYRDEPPQAITMLREMAATIEALAEVPHVVPRMVAVHRRGEALRVLEAIARHPGATQDTHRQLLGMIDEQLAAWPSDQAAWFGDRAIGMHTYELVRDGYLLSILDDEEQARLRREVGLDRLARKVAENLDHDELFYLRSMRQAIAACQRPYFERERVFREIDGKLESLRDTPAYPLVADLILWKDVREGQRLQALDRARCEAWSIALAASVGAPPPPYNVNPLTGTRYIMDLRPDQVIVDGIDPEQGASPIVIPIPRQDPKESRQR